MTETSIFSLEGKKILIADDVSDNQLLVRLYLRTTKATIIIASAGKEVLNLVNSDCPDLILMDIQMPDMDGYESTVRLKKEGFKKPIIAMTAHAMKEEIQRCFDVGCDDVLVKPFRKKDLFEVLHRHLIASDISD
ncbi:Sensor histidine kinase RcsC [compost metagenome]